MRAKVLKVDYRSNAAKKEKIPDIIEVREWSGDNYVFAYDCKVLDNNGIRGIIGFHASSLEFIEDEIEVGDTIRIKDNVNWIYNHSGLKGGDEFVVMEMEKSDIQGDYWLRKKAGHSGILSTEVELIKKGSVNMKKNDSKVAKALKSSISHHEKMVKWVEERSIKSMNDKPDSKLMEHMIDESWYDQHCALCDLFSSNCNKCPLGAISECENGSWDTVDGSKTWIEWIENDKKLIMILKGLYKKEIEKDDKEVKIGDVWEDDNVYYQILDISVNSIGNMKVNFNSLYKRKNAYINNNVEPKWFFSKSCAKEAKLIYRIED